MSYASATTLGDGSATGSDGETRKTSVKRQTARSNPSGSSLSNQMPIPLRGTMALSLKNVAGGGAAATSTAAPVGDQTLAESKGEAGEKDSRDYKLRRLQDLCLNEPATQYNERDTGPVQPGYAFYKMLGLGPSLQVPIPDSILVDRVRIRRLRNDAKGFVVNEECKLDKQVLRDAFVGSVVESFVADSVPFGQQPHMVDLKNRFVAIRKRPCSHPQALVANTVELLTPLALQASVQEYMDSLQVCVHV